MLLSLTLTQTDVPMVQGENTSTSKVNHHANNGGTALMWAGHNGHKDVCVSLVKKQAQVDKADNNSVTALIWASQNGYDEVVKYLLSAGAKVNHADNNGD